VVEQGENAGKPHPSALHLHIVEPNLKVAFPLRFEYYVFITTFDDLPSPILNLSL